jgi:hypothetical protein
MRLELRRAPAGLELLDEVTRRKDFYPPRPDSLGRASVHPGQVRDRALRRILHRHAAQSREQPVKARFMLLQAGVHALLTRQVVEVRALDGVDQTPWLTDRRNQVVPPTRGHVTATGQPCQLAGDRVGPVEVV